MQLLIETQIQLQRSGLRSSKRRNAILVGAMGAAFTAALFCLHYLITSVYGSRYSSTALISYVFGDAYSSTVGDGMLYVMVSRFLIVFGIAWPIITGVGLLAISEE